ncbi:Beta-galactosidase [Anopheles sinensis]|uniref:Beta-galactosidase n=1 Tax=Anopheles sinensis TaxID=74873 RepID=A0A084WIZ3_ANOSI|nr:Beta-galactosidase [Anopheles sinensis]
MQSVPSRMHEGYELCNGSEGSWMPQENHERGVENAKINPQHLHCNANQCQRAMENPGKLLLVLLNLNARMGRPTRNVLDVDQQDFVPLPALKQTKRKASQRTRVLVL